MAFCIESGLILLKKPIYQLIVPSTLRSKVLHQLHNQACSGHLGIRKTIGRLRRRFYWVGYKNDVKVWCATCLECQKRKSPNKKFVAPMKQYIVGAPFERVALDIMGPLPESTKGNKYILVVSDYFIK